MKLFLSTYRWCIVFILLLAVVACGQSFEAIKALRQVTVEVVDLGPIELASSEFNQPLRLSTPLTIEVPNNLGEAGSVTLLIQPSEFFTQPHLVATVEEVEPNNSGAGSQVAAKGTVQIDGAISDADTSTTLATGSAHDFFSIEQQASENRLVMLTSDSASADFELFVLNAAGSVIVTDSSGDEDSSSSEVELVSYIATLDQSAVFAAGKSSSDSINVGYHISTSKLTAEVEANDTLGTAQSIAGSGALLFAVSGAASSMDLNTTVDIDGVDSDVEDFYSFTSLRNSNVSFALKMIKPFVGDLNLHVIRKDTGEVLGSATTDQTSATNNVESMVLFLPAGVEIAVLVDAVTGSANYLLGVQVISEEISAKPLLVLTSLVDPDGQSIFGLTDQCTDVSFDDDDCTFQEDMTFEKIDEFVNAINQSVGIDAGSFILPNNSSNFPLTEGLIAPGDYEVNLSGVYLDNVTVGNDHTLTSDVKLLVKTDSDLSFGEININLYFVGEDVADSATSSSGALRVDEVLEGLSTIFGQVGVEVGGVSQISLTDESANSLSVDFDLDDEQAITSLFSNIEREDGVINIFLIESFSIPGVVGLSLGIPGMPVVEGFPTSATIFAMLTPLDEQSGTQLNILAQTVAHEIGHYLGLYHPSEATGAEFDPLTDTPECTSDANDTNDDGFVVFSECEGAGNENLMFWVLPDNIADINNLENKQLTEQQGFVLNVNHYVR